MNFRKFTALILTAAMACSMLSGCKKEEEVTEPSLDPTVTETTTTETSETTTEATTRPTRALDELIEGSNKGLNECNQTLADIKAERDQKLQDLAKLKQDLANAQQRLAAAQAMPCDYIPCE